MQYDSVCINLLQMYIYRYNLSNLFPGVGIMENYYFLDGGVFCIFQFSQHITHFFLKYTE